MLSRAGQGQSCGAGRGAEVVSGGLSQDRGSRTDRWVGGSSTVQGAVRVVRGARIWNE